MSKRKYQTQVGLFALIGISMIVVSIIMVGGDRAFFKKYLRLHATFDSVQGLARGSVISLAGLTVGNVEDITFNSKTSRLDVILRVDENYKGQLFKDAKVDIKTQGALGDKYIFIAPGHAESGILNDGDKIEVDSSPDILGIIASRGSEAEKIFDIMNEVYILTKSLNQENRIGSIMRNMDQASKNMSTASADAQKMMARLNNDKTLERMGSIVSKIDQGEGTLGLLINDPTLHNQIKGYLGGSQKKDYLKSVLRSSIEKGSK